MIVKIPVLSSKYQDLTLYISLIILGIKRKKHARCLRLVCANARALGIFIISEDCLIGSMLPLYP